jgi:hypothetical protein
MSARALSGTCLERLVRMASPLLRAAQRQCPRAGPGRLPDYQDWQMAFLILVAVLHRRKSKSAQYRFLHERRATLQEWLHLKDFPARSTYCLRYRQAHRLFREAVGLQGARVLAEGLADATAVAVDKSLIAARGPVWHARRRPSPGVDPAAGWGYSDHDGWVWGYSFETVVTATRHSRVVPLLASVGAANASECRSVLPKIPHLPAATRYVLADRAYDTHACQEAVELDPQGRPTGRRFLCPLVRRFGKLSTGLYPQRGRRGRQGRRRRRRLQFLHSPRGRRLYARRSQTVEPFHEWFKHSFELTDRVWHRGLDNNQTQLLAALFGYQLLLRYNHRCGHRNAQVQWILDAL